MVSSRKRGRQEMEAAEPSPPPKEIKENSLLERIRNSWEFANLGEWIYLFGEVVKIDEKIDIEKLEMECLKTHSTVLPEIGLAILKFVSSHRGLTPELFDEYTRRQYTAKAPNRNPFGVEEEPAKFAEFDVITKLRVLQQLTQWAMMNPDRIREKAPEQKDTEQTIWRIEDYGWDADDRTYISLHDRRLYRRTDPPPPPEPKAKPKKNSKKSRASLRASKRRKLSEPGESEADHTPELEDGESSAVNEDNGLGGAIWECVAITLDEYNALISSMEKTRDPNEKDLRKRIIENILPELEKVEEDRKRKAAQAEKELLNAEKLLTAKRSSRLQGKAEQQKHEEELREAERKKAAELVMAKKEQAKWMKLEKERESRMITREQRLKEREARRILHEEELANLSEDGKKIELGEGRLSERHLKAEIERKKQAIEELAEEEDWIFDCICGAYGQIDDGTHSIACEKCNIWQHSKCVGVSEAEAEREEFVFICTTCVRRAKDAERAKTQPPIKIKLNRPGSSSSSGAHKENGSPMVLIASPSNGSSEVQSSPQNPQQSPLMSSPVKKNLPHLASWAIGSTPSPKHNVQVHQGQNEPSMSTPASNVQNPKVTPFSLATKASQADSSSFPTNGTISTPNQSFSQPPGAHAFSSPHPQSPINLPPPSQPKLYHFVNGNSHNQNGQVYVSGAPQIQGTPSNPTSQRYGAPRPGSSDGYRRNSVTMPSPLASAPILASAVQTPAASQPVGSPTGSFSKPPYSSPPEASAVGSTLPPSSTGISPTKHSPPRVTSNGYLGSATPSMLPPVASMSPISHIQDLTPPVKSSPDSSWNRSNGQGVTGQGSSF